MRELSTGRLSLEARFHARFFAPPLFNPGFQRADASMLGVDGPPGIDRRVGVTRDDCSATRKVGYFELGGRGA